MTDAGNPKTGPAVLDFSDCVLLTIHGVTSENQGLANLRAACERALPGIIVDSYFYGEVVPFQDLSEAVQYFIFRSIREKLELVYLKHLKGTNRRLFVVAHSFGTLAVIRALEMHVPHLTVSGLVLLGSIVPRHHPWDGLVESGQLADTPFVIVRRLDRVVRFGTLVGGGASGALGFVSMGNRLAHETFKSGGHTSYDPHDHTDVITYVRDGINAIRLVTFDEWKATCGWFARFRLFIGQ